MLVQAAVPGQAGEGCRVLDIRQSHVGRIIGKVRTHRHAGRVLHRATRAGCHTAGRDRAHDCHLHVSVCLYIYKYICIKMYM